MCAVCAVLPILELCAHYRHLTPLSLYLSLPPSPLLLLQGQTHAVTSTHPDINPWWNLFTTCLQEQCGAHCDDMIFPAATDSRFLRALGIRAIGFSPMRNSSILLHENDEYLDKTVFVEGCVVYEKVLRVLLSQERMSCDEV